MALLGDPIQRMPIDVPSWATDSTRTLQPSGAEKAAGWPEGFRPPARWQNWWQRVIFQTQSNAQAQLRKDFRRTIARDMAQGLDADESPLCYHKGYYYTRSVSSHWHIYRSSDLKGWNDTGNPTVLAFASHTIASDGSRMVFTSAGAAGDNLYSDNDGDSYAGSLTGTGTNPRIFYLPANDIWVGTSSLNTIVSLAGIAYAATAGAAGVIETHNFQAAERPNGLIALCGGGSGIYTVNSGSTWAATSTALALNGYYYSEVRGNLVAFGSGGVLREMSGTPGTWESVDFGAFPAGWSNSGMFDMHGAMYSYGSYDDPATPANPPILGVIMTLDQGTTWELVHTISEEFAGVTELEHLNPVQPLVGHQPGGNTGMIGMLGRINATASLSASITPPYVGQNFAATLAP